MKMQEALIASENLIRAMQAGYRPESARRFQELIEVMRDHLQELKDLSVTLAKSGDDRRLRAVIECAADTAELLCRLEIGAAVMFGVRSTRIKVNL